MKILFVTATVFFGSLLAGCTCNCGSEVDDMKVHIKYDYKDEFDGFQNKFTKDLVLDGTIDTTMYLTEEEKMKIAELAADVKFFGLPDTINSTVDGMQSPSPGRQMLRIKLGVLDKTVYWWEPSGNSDFENRIKTISRGIRKIIRSKPEYEALPPARGGYL